MEALIRMISYSFEIMLSKLVLKEIHPIKLLANKYLIGVLVYIPFLLYSSIYIAQEGWVILFLSVNVCSANQILAFTSLENVSSSTHVLIKQTKMILLLIIGIFFSYTITFSKVVAVVFSIIGTTFIIYQETKESENRQNTTKGIICCFTSIVFDVLNVYITNYGLNKNLFSPSIYTFFTIISILVVFYLLQYQKTQNTTFKIDKKVFWMIQLTGILSIIVILTKAISYKQYGFFLSEMIYVTSPVFILIIMFFIKAEKITSRKIVGMILNLAGLYLAMKYIK